MSSKIEFELYSICLELTNNILKHAQATEARLVFERQNGSLHLHITDNGKGLGGKWEMKNGDVGGIVNHIVVAV